MKYLAPEEVRSKRGNLKYLDDLRQLARSNRNFPTEGELVMWRILKNEKLGFLFLRQKPMGKFILDFYCSKLLLVIEIDGDSHDKKQYLDKSRDLYLEQRGIKTIRYKNEEVLKNIEEIKKDLEMKIKERKSELNF
jgi:very-short-patch-repair endonuclease